MSQNIPEENTYIIKYGDRFWNLENEWGMPHGTLQELNPEMDPTRLYPGDEIQIQMPTLAYMIAEPIPTEMQMCPDLMDSIIQQSRPEMYGPFQSDSCFNIDNTCILDNCASDTFYNPSSSMFENVAEKGIKGANVVRKFGTLASIYSRKLLTSNELWHFQKNGTIITPWKKMKNGQLYAKNNLVQMHRDKFRKGADLAAKNVRGAGFLSALKKAGPVMLIGDMAASGEMKASHAVGFAFIGAAALTASAPAVVIAAGIYFVADIGLELTTWAGITEGGGLSRRLDGWVENNFGKLELYEGLY